MCVVDRQSRRSCGVLRHWRRAHGKIAAHVLLRVTPGIDPHTHRRIRTGQEDTKFGLVHCRKRRSTGSGHGSARSRTGTSRLTACTAISGRSFWTRRRTSRPSMSWSASCVRWPTQTGWMPESFGHRRRPRHPVCGRSARRPPMTSLQKRLSRRCRAALEQVRKFLSQHALAGTGPGAGRRGRDDSVHGRCSSRKSPFPKRQMGTRTYVAIDGGMSDNPRPQLV